MATLDQVDKWLTDNEDKKGTPEYDIAVNAYILLNDDAKAGMPPTGDQFGDVGPPTTPLMSGEEVFDQEVVVEEPDMLSEITGGIVRGLAPAAIGTAAGFAAGGPLAC